MKKSRALLCLMLLAACGLTGCATEEPRMRAGIQDPIERHPHGFWSFLGTFD